MKKTIIIFWLTLAISALYGQEKTVASSDEEAVKQTLKKYKDALQNLNVTGTSTLFSEDATIFENGKYEGTYQNYLDHHIGPELGHFKEFSYNNYTVNVRLKNNVAVAYETYTYKIVTGGEKSRTIERQGVATSVLEKIGGAWKIIQYHSSARAPK